MSEVKDEYKQQILFSEQELSVEGESKTEHENQIMFSNQDWQPDEEEIIITDDIADESGSANWLWRSIFVLFFTIIGFEAYDFFVTGFQESPIEAGIYGALLFCLTLVAGTTVIREYSGLRQFKKQQDIQTRVHALMEDNSKESAVDLCEVISNQLPCDLMSEQESQWQNIDKSDFTDQEVLELYSRVVMSKVDQKAVAEIARFSSESVVLIALSPIAILDMLIMLWRNFKLLDKISGLYGLKLGYWSRVRLVKQVIVNIVYAGASEIVTDFGADILGADMLGKLSGRLAQGLGAGLLTARLGLKVMKLCRPVPFEDNAPKLGHIRKEMLSQIKKLTLKKT